MGRYSLGNTQRGLIAAAITGNAAILVSAISEAVSWQAYLCASITTIAMLVACSIDPGYAPPKPDGPPVPGL